ncbi:MAG: CehA/McbA family metallohydrolase, partial [Deltaproteobacteria bacterium]|nr:CehA/McbA family metallohydrolase [Deltaproteobacteria bacterium]
PAGALAPGATLSYTRRVYVGESNDVAGSANLMLPELGARTGFATGTVSGDLDAIDADGVEASVIATRTGGPATPGLPVGSPVTQFRTSPADGTFSGVVLPVGTYEFEFRAEERDPVVVPNVSVTAGNDTFVSTPEMSGLGIIEFQITERSPGSPPIPARVTFIGIDGTPNPNFNKDIDAFLLSAGPPEDIDIETFNGGTRTLAGSGTAQRNFVYLDDGFDSVRVRPGKYEVFISRGPEYGISRRRVRAIAPRVQRGTVTPRSRRVRARLRRLVDTPDAISADFHIHSARSFDTSPPLEDRVTSFAGEGVEVMVSTEHDFVADYASVIAGMNLGSHVTSIVGSEITGSAPNPPAFANSIGHINAWPMPVQPDARRDGAIEDEYVAPNFVFSRLRGLGAQVIQYNHPRAGVAGLTSIGFFTNIGYDPTLPIDVPPNDLLLDDDVTGASGVANPDGLRNIDFDAMEIINGTGVNGYLASRRDWFSLLNQANLQTALGPVPFIVGTGVSDSHRITLETAGYARSYVLGVGDDPATLSTGSFNANVVAGRVMGTTGPFVEFTLSDATGATAQLGDTLVPDSPLVNLHVRVLASNWIPVEEVRIIQNGAVVQVFDATTSPAVRSGPWRPWSQSRSRVRRFEADIPLILGNDAYLLVEAGAALSPTPTPDPFVDQIVPGLVSLAFTNPIFVDLDGDGFDPPGVSALAPATAGAPAALQAQGLDASAPSSMYDGLSEEQRQEVQAHFPIYRLRIPESAVAELQAP